MQRQNSRPKTDKKKETSGSHFKTEKTKKRNVFALKYLHMDIVEYNLKNTMEAKYVQKTINNITQNVNM